MARPNRPWFRESKQAWYATVKGRMVSLGVKGRDNEAEAVKAWHRLMAGVAEKAEPKPEPAVAEVLTAFLADAEGRVKPTTLDGYRRFLLPFAKRFGAVKASALSPPVAEAYARKPTWASDTRADFLGALVTAFRWADRSRLIERTPLAGLRKPPKASRGAEAVIGPADHERLLEAAGERFKPVLRLLHLTGARPGEVARIDTDNFDPEGGTVRLKDHKTAHKTGKARTIYLCRRSRRRPLGAKGEVRRRLPAPLPLRRAVHEERRRQGDGSRKGAGRGEERHRIRVSARLRHGRLGQRRSRRTGSRVAWAFGNDHVASPL